MKIPYIPGDGIGPEIWAVTRKIVDAAVASCYTDEKTITWIHALAGEEAIRICGKPLPEDTLDLLKEYRVSIKGPLTTPVGDGFKSINVQIRQELDLYCCLRPMKYTEGVVSPLRNPENIDMTIFRENTEDVYTGIEFESGTGEAQKMVSLIEHEFNRGGIRFPKSSAIAIKPISKEGSERIIRSAINYALEYSLPSVTIVHKGNILKYTEGAFKNWGYDLVQSEFNDRTYTWDDYAKIEKEFGREKADQYLEDQRVKGRLLIKDRIADAFFQDILLNPKSHSVVVATNLNGDYISDAVAGCIGGIGISPGANINFITGRAVFEATHGSAPDIAGKDIANPLSLVLSAAMMLDFIGYGEAARMIKKTTKDMCQTGLVTNDLSPNREGLSCSEFGEAFLKQMESPVLKLNEFE